MWVGRELENPHRWSPLPLPSNSPVTHTTSHLLSQRDAPWGDLILTTNPDLILAACGSGVPQCACPPHGHRAPSLLTSLEKRQVASQHPDKPTWCPDGISRKGVRGWQEPSWEHRWDASQSQHWGSEGGTRGTGAQSKASSMPSTASGLRGPRHSR